MRFTMLSGGAAVHGHGADTVVPWWSFTKTVLAAAALTLVRDGRAQLDTRLEDQPFTLRQLLRHQAGLGDYGHISDYHTAVAHNEEPWSVEEMLKRADAGNPCYPPGHGWQYSNIGYLHVRQLIQAETGQELNAALHRLVFEPLDIAGPHVIRTVVEWQETLTDQPLYNPGWVYHGLLVGQLVDAATFLDRLMTGRLLPPYLLREMHDVHQFPGPFPGRPWEKPGYGLGLMTAKSDTGATLLGHTGAGPGSVIAVYFSADSGATAGAYAAGDDQAVVEREAIRLLK